MAGKRQIGKSDDRAPRPERVGTGGAVAFFKEIEVDKLQDYVGRLVRLRPAIFVRLANAARRRGVVVENSFIVASARTACNKLVCCGAEQCLLVGPADVSLV